MHKITHMTKQELAQDIEILTNLLMFAKACQGLQVIAENPCCENHRPEIEAKRDDALVRYESKVGKFLLTKTEIL